MKKATRKNKRNGKQIIRKNKHLGKIEKNKHLGKIEKYQVDIRK